MAKGFTKATAKREYMKAGLYGKTGSGKSLTTLLMAEKLAEMEGKRIAYIDTEKGTAFYIREVPERKVHPAAFDIDTLETKSMFDALEAVEGLDPAVHGVVVVDSITALWEAAKGTYQGKLTSKGGIPVQAWSAIKKPYKRLISLLMDGKYHAFVCGREGVDMTNDDDGDPVVVGAKMKSESETPFEFHLLMRMVPEREENGAHKIRVFFEKDRSGILTGKTFDWPTFQTVEPAVRILMASEASAVLGTPEEVAARDAASAELKREAEEAERVALYTQIRNAINGAPDLDALKSAWSLVSGKKGKLGEDSMENLEAAKDAKKLELLGKVA